MNYHLTKGAGINPAGMEYGGRRLTLAWGEEINISIGGSTRKSIWGCPGHTLGFCLV